ncbi:MAG: hypothetical protein HKP46_09520, partial [Myxococcales bacterium]|nr:hypothetical protein [Myxococcales bacterium]
FAPPRLLHSHDLDPDPVQLRHSLRRIYSQRDLAFLDADENPEEEQFREMD